MHERDRRGAGRGRFFGSQYPPPPQQLRDENRRQAEGGVSAFRDQQAVDQSLVCQRAKVARPIKNSPRQLPLDFEATYAHSAGQIRGSNNVARRALR